MINNPIIKGFHPDPNILRVEEDYYIVTSTFQWYPGIEIHHSKNLTDWELINRPLDNERFLEMTGENPGCGVWAPNITYFDGEFYIVYSDCKTFGSVHNYLITSKSINGPWSDPIYLCSGAFDLSMYHEDDEKYLLLCEHDGKTMANMANIVEKFPSIRSFNAITGALLSGNRKILVPFHGIALLEYDHANKRVIGERKIIFEGTKLGATEGPNLYKKGDYYYLITAEGGTGYRHAVTMARSKSILGPYEVHPENPILTSTGKKSAMQRVGHGSIVETKDGEIYMSFLFSRPFKYKKGSILGRESGLIKMKWKNDWLYTDYNSMTITSQGMNRREYNFKSELPIDFQWLRTNSNKSLLNVSDNQLSIVGKEWIDSPFEQGLAGVRMMNHEFEAETLMTFRPKNHHQTAGIAAFYSINLYLYLSFGFNGEVTLRKCLNGIEKILWTGKTDLETSKIKLTVRNQKIQFWIEKNKRYEAVYKPISVHFLSDETSKPYGFTGGFIALCCQDLSGRNKKASFSYLKIMEGKNG